ncbi:MAG: plectin [Ruminococcus sp.]|nr:plectin [Ruminococcus sp.]
MAEPRFIKTVVFGGYEKEAVIRRMEYLNEQVHDLRNELRETKLLLEAYKKGTNEEKALETVLSEERAKLTQVQVQNNTLNLKLKATDDENNNYVQQVKDLNAEIAELKDKLKATESKCAALMAQDEAMALSNVFIEAQKSSSMLEGSAKSKAAEIEYQSKKLAESIVSDANVEAQQIIYEAERTAAETIAEAKNKAEQMDVASNNLRAAVLEDVNTLKLHMGKVRDALEGFRNVGITKLVEADECLNKTEETLKEGGVPVFRIPENIEPELPERPMTLSEKMRDDEDKRKKQEELDKLKHMAESIGNKKDDNKNDKDPSEEAAGDNAEKPQNGEKKGGKLDLAALAAKANSIKNK